jgi:hypothetical protein
MIIGEKSKELFAEGQKYFDMLRLYYPGHQKSAEWGLLTPDFIMKEGDLILSHILVYPPE